MGSLYAGIMNIPFSIWNFYTLDEEKWYWVVFGFQMPLQVLFNKACHDENEQKMQLASKVSL